MEPGREARERGSRELWEAAMAEEPRDVEETLETAVLSPIPESMEVTAAADSSDVEDSDSDSDSDAEANEKLQIQTLESELYNNPSNYDAHVQYVKLLRKMGDIQKVRQAREAMSALFPLTPVMWQDWTRDEAFFDSGPDACPVIEKLYERGVSDYLSVSLWCDYINYVQEKDPSVCGCSPEGISKARNLFERAITAAGLHIAEGNKIWEAYREFEQAILLTFDESDTEAREKQAQRIRSLFHRQLSIPLVDLESTLLTYKAWEAEQGNAFDLESSDLEKKYPHIFSAYKKAIDMYNARAQFEEQISRKDASDAERLQHYLVYLKFEQSMQDPARVNLLYERAVKDCPISADLWLDYTHYSNKTLKVGNLVKDVHLRATRNCPWVGELWVRYLLCLERCRSCESEISAVFGKSLQCTFSTHEEYLDLYLTRVDGLRRRISFAGEAKDPLDYLSIRETFQQASDYLSPHLKNTKSLLHLHAYWARLEAKLGKDIVASRGAWESFIKISGSMLEAWQGYIEMEIELGNISEARAIYKRCYSKRFPEMGSEEICRSWLRFEREFGKLEDFDFATQKVTPRLEELQLFALQQESRLTDQKENDVKKGSREKRKSSTDVTSEESPAKRKKESNRPTKAHGKDKPQLKNAAESVEVEDSKAKADKADKVPEQERKDTYSDRPKVFTDQCTAFVSNIDPKANNNHLREFFGDVGGVVAVRILHDKFTGKSRGLAYVDFVDEQHLAAAVAKNKKMLLGKKLSIARSNPKKGRKDSGHAASGEQSGKAEPSGSRDARGGNREEPGRPPRPPAARKRGLEDVPLKGRNTFAMPRSVKPLGWSASKGNAATDEGEDEAPKSNDEFRQMLLKK